MIAQEIIMEHIEYTEDRYRETGGVSGMGEARRDVANNLARLLNENGVGAEVIMSEKEKQEARMITLENSVSRILELLDK